MTVVTRPLRLLSLVALALALLLSACGNAITPAAAEVNGQKIPQDALDDELEAMRANVDYVDFLQSQGNEVLGSGQGTFNGDFVRRVLTRQIYLALVHAEFVEQKLKLTDQDRQLVRGDVANEVGGPDIFEKFDKAYQDTLIRRSAEVAVLQLKLSGAEVDDAAVRKFYDDNPNLFLETCVRHILFAVLDPTTGRVDTAQTEAQSADLLAQAQAAQGRIAAGEDFAALAAELSKDASNKGDGGNLGCSAAGQFVPEFETAMDATQPGQVSAPTKTQFGYHLIKVDSRGAKPFEEVTDQIREQLLGEASQGFGTFLSEALTEADVEINPRYGRFSKDLQNPGVLAPTTPTTQPVGGPAGGGEQQTIDLGG